LVASTATNDYGAVPGSSDVKTVTITAENTASRFTFGERGAGPKDGIEMITEVLELPVWINRYQSSFKGASNLTSIPNKLPRENIGLPEEVSVVVDTRDMFNGASNFNSD
jgi:hypothetical protein